MRWLAGFNCQPEREKLNVRSSDTGELGVRLGGSDIFEHFLPHVSSKMYVQFLSKAYLFPSFCLFCLFRVEFMICSNNMVTWETGCKQILLHPPRLASGPGLGILLYISDWIFHNGRDGWLTFPAIMAEFSSLVVTAVITIPASGPRLMSLTCLANIKRITLSPGRRSGGESGHQLRVE